MLAGKALRFPHNCVEPPEVKRTRLDKTAKLSDPDVMATIATSSIRVLSRSGNGMQTSTGAIKLVVGYRRTSIVDGGYREPTTGDCEALMRLTKVRRRFALLHTDTDELPVLHRPGRHYDRYIDKTARGNVRGAQPDGFFIDYRRVRQRLANLHIPHPPAEPYDHAIWMTFVAELADLSRQGNLGKARHVWSMED